MRGEYHEKEIKIFCICKAPSYQPQLQASSSPIMVYSRNSKDEKNTHMKNNNYELKDLGQQQQQ